MDSEEKNAVIRSTMLGYEDHGFLTAVIDLDYGGSGQGFGQYIFGNRQPGLKTGFGVDFIAAVLRVADVDEWEKLKGRPVRVRGHHAKVEAIGHYLKEDWFYPEELNQRYQGQFDALERDREAQTLEKSFIQPDRPLLIPATGCSIQESRTIPEVIAEQGPVDGNS